MLNGAEGERFLLSDNALQGGSRIIIFATDRMLQLLGSTEDWYMDGNYKLAPSLFTQLYVIRTVCGRVHVTAAYILLENKAQSTYEEVFNTLLNECHERGIYPDPQNFYVDFEIAVFQAIRQVYGNEVSIQGCFYHLCQNTYRKVQDLGLVSRYNKDEDFNLFCGMLDSLAFLGSEDVCKGMDHLKEITPEGGQDLVDYFDQNYVSGTFRKVGKQSELTMKMKRCPPRFPVDTWNVHDRTLEGLPRTNNLTEGWNNRFGYIVNMRHPCIFVLIKKMRMEVSADYTKLDQQDLGLVARKKKRSLAETKDTQLFNLCSQLVQKEMDIPKFLRSVSSVIRFRCLD